MNEKEYDVFINKLASTLDEVLTFDIRQKAIYAFKNSLNYKQCISNFIYNQDGNKSLRLLEKLFHYDINFFVKIIGHKVVVNGKLRRYTSDVVKIIKNTSKYLKFIGKKNIKYSSGKTFSHRSFIVINEKSIDTLFLNKRFGLTTSYSEEARKSIHQYILGTTMTKKQKEQYQKEYDEGKHLLSLEEYLKAQAKKKRQADKHRMTIAKKAARATLAEYA